MDWRVSLWGGCLSAFPLEAGANLVPTVQLAMTLGHRKMTVDELRRIGDVTDVWIAWDSYFAEEPKTWFGALHHLDGNFMYQLYDLPGGIGARDFKTTTSGGIVRFNDGQAVPSIRSMAWREGVIDVKYAAKYLSLAGNTPAAQTFVDKLVRRVMVDNRHDPAEADRARAELVREIRAMIGKGR